MGFLGDAGAGFDSSGDVGGISSLGPRSCAFPTIDDSGPGDEGGISSLGPRSCAVPRIDDSVPGDVDDGALRGPDGRRRSGGRCDVDR